MLNITFENKANIHTMMGFLAMGAFFCLLMVVSMDAAAVGVFLGILTTAKKRSEIYHVRKVLKSTSGMLKPCKYEYIYLYVSWSVKWRRQ